jgi:hypothetical protein
MKSRAAGLSVRVFNVMAPIDRRIAGKSIGGTLSNPSPARRGACAALHRDQLGIEANIVSGRVALATLAK